MTRRGFPTFVEVVVSVVLLLATNCRNGARGSFIHPGMAGPPPGMMGPPGMPGPPPGMMGPPGMPGPPPGMMGPPGMPPPGYGPPQMMPVQPHPGHPGFMAPPPPPPTEAAPNERLLSLKNNMMMGDFQEFVELNKHKLPPCSHFREVAGSCDPEMDLNPCVACMSGKHFKSFAGCPSVESFKQGLDKEYEWQYAGSTAASMRRTQFICLVREGKQPPQWQQQQQMQQQMMPPEEAAGGGGNSTILLLVIGAAAVLFFLVGGVGVACMIMK